MIIIMHNNIGSTTSPIAVWESFEITYIDLSLISQRVVNVLREINDLSHTRCGLTLLMILYITSLIKRQVKSFSVNFFPFFFLHMEREFYDKNYYGDFIIIIL